MIIDPLDPLETFRLRHPRPTNVEMITSLLAVSACDISLETFRLRHPRSEIIDPLDRLETFRLRHPRPTNVEMTGYPSDPGVAIRGCSPALLWWLFVAVSPPQR